MSRTPKTDAEWAEFYGCSPRTVARWKRDGAPFENSRRMQSWLAGRKNIPAKLKQQLAESNRTRRASIATIDPQESTADAIGAPAALKRLEQTEFVAFRLLESAIKSGDVHEIKAAREGWLKVGDSLRRYDVMVESARRNSGEMVQRAEVERHVANLIRCLKLAIVRTASAMAPELAGINSPSEVDDLLKTVLFDQILTAAVGLAAMPCKAQVPEWLIACISRAMNETLEDASGVIEKRLRAFQELFGAMCEASAS